LNYILKNENAIYYECGYSCDNAIYIKLGSEAYFITDSRYTIEANAEVRGAMVVESSNLLKSAKSILRAHNITLFYNPREWSFFDIETLKKLKYLNLKPKVDFSAIKRAIKSDEEIEIIKEAVRLGKDGFDRFANFLQSNGNGKNEKYLNFQNRSDMTNFGELDISFEAIVAINANAAKPHALPTDLSLNSGDLLLVDAGIKYKRYCSDRTRTSYYDENITFDISQKYKDSKIQKMYDIVLKAHDEAIAKAKVGMRAKEIDKIARDVIVEAGYGEYFVHSTGHGVGLDIHEYPYISSRSEMVIEENMVFTIEPGIYIEDEFGIRIEDMVVMRKDGAEIL
jgi:Xaa-Pro aminopeptidase